MVSFSGCIQGREPETGGLAHSVSRCSGAQSPWRAFQRGPAATWHCLAWDKETTAAKLNCSDLLAARKQGGLSILADAGQDIFGTQTVL